VQVTRPGKTAAVSNAHQGVDENQVNSFDTALLVGVVRRRDHAMNPEQMRQRFNHASIFRTSITP
jgi:hypothetical protein